MPYKIRSQGPAAQRATEGTHLQAFCSRFQRGLPCNGVLLSIGKPSPRHKQALGPTGSRRHTPAGFVAPLEPSNLLLNLSNCCHMQVDPTLCYSVGCQKACFPKVRRGPVLATASATRRVPAAHAKAWEPPTPPLRGGRRYLHRALHSAWCNISRVPLSVESCWNPMGKKLTCSTWLPLNKHLPWTGQTQDPPQLSPPRSCWHQSLLSVRTPSLPLSVTIDCKYCRARRGENCNR
jgi:hypothetical protein